MQNTVFPMGNATVTLAPNEKLAVWTAGQAIIQQVLNLPNYQNNTVDVATVLNGQYVTSAYANGATLSIQAGGGAQVLYEIGSDPIVQSLIGSRYQAAPNSLNAANHTLTAAILMNGIITSNTSNGATTGTLSTGALLEAASDFAANDSFSWTVINTGATNAYTVAASTGHTIVGNAVVAISSSGRFRTRKVSDGVFVTYRLS